MESYKMLVFLRFFLAETKNPVTFSAVWAIIIK